MPAARVKSTSCSCFGVFAERRRTEPCKHSNSVSTRIVIARACNTDKPAADNTKVSSRTLMKASRTRGGSAVTYRSRASPRRGRNPRNGHWSRGSMRNSVTIATKRFNLMNTETNTIWRHHVDEHSNKSCTFSKALFLSMFAARTTTRDPPSRTLLPRHDTGSADDFCFSSQASDYKPYAADGRWQRGSHTDRITIKLCTGECNMNRMGNRVELSLW